MYHPHLMREKTEALRGLKTCPGPSEIMTDKQYFYARGSIVQWIKAKAVK